MQDTSFAKFLIWIDTLLSGGGTDVIVNPQNA